jgi:hypothetical protein
VKLLAVASTSRALNSAAFMRDAPAGSPMGCPAGQMEGLVASW